MFFDLSLCITVSIPNMHFIASKMEIPFSVPLVDKKEQKEKGNYLHHLILPTIRASIELCQGLISESQN